MLQHWVDAAKSNQSVWLTDVQEALAKDSKAVPAVMQLSLCSGEKRDFQLPVPRWNNPEQRQFVKEYVSASVYNVLAALSGRNLTFFLPQQEAAVRQLLEELPDLFQVRWKKRSGYGKVINVANRLCRAFGSAPFCFDIKNLADYTPAPESKRKNPGNLAVRLRAIEQRAEHGAFCGVDIGGTDIKLALAVDNRLVSVKVMDWNPASYATAERIMSPIADFIGKALDEAAPGVLLDGLGVSYPDVVIENRILGGETPKTRGMRDNPGTDYELEFQKIGNLNQYLARFCKPGVKVQIINDGHMAAFTAAMELSHSDNADLVNEGVIAHSIGTDLGTGWIPADGSIPPVPMEIYDFLLDLGRWQDRLYPPEDLRCVCNENSGLPGVRRYVGQSAAFRLAQQNRPELLESFASKNDGVLSVQEAPRDLRKPCLEHLMQCAQDGDAAAEDVFRQIGMHTGQVTRESAYIFRPETKIRFLFGRFVKMPRCFALLQEGNALAAPDTTLAAADENLACTPLMQALARQENVTVAQFGQAVGAIYFGVQTES